MNISEIYADVILEELVNKHTYGKRAFMITWKPGGYFM